MQFTHGIILFVATRNRSRATEFVEVVDNTADAGCLACVAVWVGNEHAGVGIPFCCGIATGRGVVGAVDVECFAAYILHGCTQHATIAA